MKRKAYILSLMVLVLATIVMTACTGSSFGMVTNDEKSMSVTAEKSGDGDSATSGSIVVGEEEQITIDSNLDSGSIQLDFISNEGFDDMEEVPDLENAEVKYTTTVSEVESQAVSFGAGSYLVRATVVDNANGTVEIKVKGFGEE